MKNSVKIIFIFSLIGILFSGYLTFTSLFLKSCPLKEGCPYFFGYPSCFYGFFIFLILFILSLYSFKDQTNKLLKYVSYVSFIGILFAVYSSIQEIFYSSCLDGKCDYSLLLPTCLYGLVMYIVIFISSILAKNKD